jgi:aspartyl-tRNA(Asn)/glutamyl-tRNA(Gln) amidotransferase subunit A
VRLPAAFNGIVGFKPTYGRISRSGLVAFSSSCDQIGIFSRTVADAARVFAAISGEDPKDASTAQLPAWDDMDALNRDIGEIRVGIPEEYFPNGIQEECKAAVVDVLAWLMAECIPVSGVHLPMTKYAVAANYVVANVEACANLARYDGIRYGLREDAATIDKLYASSRSAGFGPEVRRRILLGAYFSTHKGGKRYQQALRVRRKICQDFESAFNNVDIIMTPTTAETAFPLRDRANNPRKMYLSDSMNTPANMAGIPAISIPVGADKNGFPVGIQLMACWCRQKRFPGGNSTYGPSVERNNPLYTRSKNP